MNKDKIVKKKNLLDTDNDIMRTGEEGGPKLPKKLITLPYPAAILNTIIYISFINELR